MANRDRGSPHNGGAKQISLVNSPLSFRGANRRFLGTAQLGSMECSMGAWDVQCQGTWPEEHGCGSLHRQPQQLPKKSCVTCLGDVHFGGGPSFRLLHLPPTSSAEPPLHHRCQLWTCNDLSEGPSKNKNGKQKKQKTGKSASDPWGMHVVIFLALGSAALQLQTKLPLTAAPARRKPLKADHSVAATNSSPRHVAISA